jgi:Flp pilus assembly protein TadD
MTERGKGMVEEGRIQEAIDQFTKALALDGSYGPALESRAQAYASQGRTAEAEEDRRQLEAVSNG